MGLNPTILRQVRACALAVTPSEPPPVHRRGYRASGLVLTSIRDLAQTSQMRKKPPFADAEELPRFSPLKGANLKSGDWFAGAATSDWLKTLSGTAVASETSLADGLMETPI